MFVNLVLPSCYTLSPYPPAPVHIEFVEQLRHHLPSRPQHTTLWTADGHAGQAAAQVLWCDASITICGDGTRAGHVGVGRGGQEIETTFGQDVN